MTSLSSKHRSLSNHFVAAEPKYKHKRSYSYTSLALKQSQSFLNELVEICVEQKQPNKSKQEEQFAYDILSNQPFHRIYIFDFDDTIFPTSIVQKNKKIWNHTELSSINEFKQCHSLYVTVKKCVEYILNLQTRLIAKYGKNNISFAIITNASTDWFNEIKNDHSSLIAQLIDTLETHIPIISAKDEFELKYDDWYSGYSTIAKTDSFVKYIQSLNIKNKIPVIYSIGDGKPEFEGSLNACQELYDGAVYILNRIQLKSNKKSRNKKFKSLNAFWNILAKTTHFLFHNDNELTDILDQKINTDDTESENDDENMTNIIDYRL